MESLWTCSNITNWWSRREGLVETARL